MTSMAGGEVILKSDVMGRVRTPLERRRSLLEEFDKSGLSGAKFAEISGVKYSTLAYWLQKRRRERREGNPAKEPVDSAKSMRWLEAVIEQAQSPGAKES